jgi:NNP family nitrate/nitrite transporter-like MFS transporter
MKRQNTDIKEEEMYTIKGTPTSGLAGATLGFLVRLAAVSLFGPTVEYLQEYVGLTPALAGLLISIPNLSGLLLRIPFSAMIDTTSGRKPFLIFHALSIIGALGILIILFQPAHIVSHLFVLLMFAGVLGGYGIATFSVCNQPDILLVSSEPLGYYSGRLCSNLKPRS